LLFADEYLTAEPYFGAAFMSALIPCLPYERMLAHVRFRDAVERRVVTGTGRKAAG
jgi:hypothetical protein